MDYLVIIRICRIEATDLAASLVAQPISFVFLLLLLWSLSCSYLVNCTGLVIWCVDFSWFCWRIADPVIRVCEIQLVSKNNL
jgi:hypothetical protein